MDERDQLVDRGAVAAGPLDEQRRHVVGAKSARLLVRFGSAVTAGPARADAILRSLTVVTPLLRLPPRPAALGRKEGSVGTTRQDGVRVLIVVCAVTAWPDLAIARQPEAGLPANLYVDPLFQPVVEGM